MLHTFGDSISAGYGASSTSSAFPSLLAANKDVTISNHAVHGNMVPDQAWPVYSSQFQHNDSATLMLGTNDERIYGDDVSKKELFAGGLAALAAYISSQPMKAIESGDYSGSWENTYAYGIGKNSYTKGSKCSFVVSGTVVLIGFIRQVSSRGLFTVKIDGVDVGEYSTNGDGITTAAGAAYGPDLLRFDGLSSGEHNIDIEVVSDTSSYSRVYIDWWSGNSAGTPIQVANIPYALEYGSGGSKENVDAYNSAIAQVVDELSGFGLPVELVDVNSSLTPLDMYDDYHPNDSGHRKIFQTFDGGSGVTFEKVELFLGSDGVLYVGECKTPISSFM